MGGSERHENIPKSEIGASLNHDAKLRNLQLGAITTYISGSFCVSITAATGIPKFEAGPQKSALAKIRQRFSCTLSSQNKTASRDQL